MNDEPTVSVRGLRYSYGSSVALAGVDFEIGTGITGVIGANGAGKTTLLSVLSGSAQRYEGDVSIAGMTPDKARAAGSIGFMPELPRLEPFLTVAEFFEGLAALLSTQATDAHEQLGSLWGKRLGTLSHGQRRRVELFAALLGEPSLLLLDEPTNGLDPLAIIEFRDTVHAIRSGRTVLISSHHLDELQRTADRFIFLATGRCAGCWDAAALRESDDSLEDLFRSLA